MGRLSPTLSVRISDKLRASLREVQKKFDLDSKSYQSAIARSSLWKDAFLCLSSPYFARNARHFIFVAADGDIYYRAVHDLHFNTNRHRLPAYIGMKPEKRQCYEAAYAENPAKIRDVWMMNFFSAWTTAGTASNVFSTHVDRLGLTGKSADLRIEQPKDEVVSREVAVALSDYVQRRGKADTQDDRGDIPIDIPTMNLDIQIVVDADLYSGSEFYKDSAIAIGAEIRNRESAVVKYINAGDPESLTPEDQMIFVSDRYPGEGHESVSLEVIKDSFGNFAKRLSCLARETTRGQDGKPVVESEEARSKLQALKLPSKFLFGRLTWPRPYLGLEACLTWNKPD